MNDLVIETNDLTKCYGEQVCVAQLCLHVPKGKIYALLGRNGAGKTTTMKMLLNLVYKSSGELTSKCLLSSPAIAFKSVINEADGEIPVIMDIHDIF